jgi:hypothetical protein
VKTLGEFIEELRQLDPDLVVCAVDDGRLFSAAPQLRVQAVYRDEFGAVSEKRCADTDQRVKAVVVGLL